MPMFEELLGENETQTPVRIKLYELLTVLVELDDDMINDALTQTGLLALAIADFEKFDTNSNMLLVLAKLFTRVTCSVNCPELANMLYLEHNLLRHFSCRFSITEYTLKPSKRKDIYAFISQFIRELHYKIEQNNESMKVFKAIAG